MILTDRLQAFLSRSALTVRQRIIFSGEGYKILDAGLSLAGDGLLTAPLLCRLVACCSKVILYIQPDDAGLDLSFKYLISAE